MKYNKIAYVNDIDIFNISTLSNIEFAKKYHALGAYYLINRLKDHYEIVWVNEAINNIQNGKWRPEEVLVIQDMSSKSGKKLLNLGAFPFINICYEGPFIGHSYYQKINYFGKIFKKLIIFDDEYPDLKFNKNKIMDLGFPCIETQLVENKFSPFSKKEWDLKKFIVGIWANKHYSLHRKKIFNHLKNFNWKYLLFEFISKLISKTYKKNLKKQLIDKRNETFINMSELVQFDLFGRGWSEFNEVPYKILKKMNNFKDNIYDGNISLYKNLSKKQIYKKYKFALCFENSISRSYITEKIFDCFTNKIIPIYYGAPNITQYVPENCFIDYRNFKDDVELSMYLKSINIDDANKYLYNAHKFLLSEESKRNKCDYFAESIFIELERLNSL